MSGQAPIQTDYKGVSLANNLNCLQNTDWMMDWTDYLHNLEIYIAIAINI